MLPRPVLPGLGPFKSTGGGLDACSPNAPGADCANAADALPQQLGSPVGGPFAPAGSGTASAARPQSKERRRTDMTPPCGGSVERKTHDPDTQAAKSLSSGVGRSER